MHRPRAGALVALALPAALAFVAGCSSPRATSTPGATVAPTGSPAAAPTIDAEQPGLTPAAGQVDTEWGPIWESVPEGFPVPPGAQPADPEAGPVSAAYTVPGASVSEARAVANFYGQAFAGVGYGGGIDGPLEDGSLTTWASNGYGCDILVTVLPRGETESLVTVLYGAGCRFEWVEGG